jgi:hypothetical protein
MRAEATGLLTTKASPGDHQVVGLIKKVVDHMLDKDFISIKEFKMSVSRTNLFAIMSSSLMLMTTVTSFAAPAPTPAATPLSVPLPALEKPGHAVLPGHINTKQATLLYAPHGLQSLMMRRFSSVEEFKNRISAFPSISTDEITWRGSKRTVFREVIRTLVAKKAIGQFGRELQEYLKKSDTATAQADLGVAKAVSTAFN